MQKSIYNKHFTEEAIAKLSRSAMKPIGMRVLKLALNCATIDGVGCIVISYAYGGR